MSCVKNEEIKCLFEDITVLLTGGKFELEFGEEEWCSLLRMTIDDFYSYIHKWIIDNKFTNIFGKKVTAADICLSITTSSFDYEMLLSQAFSEEVGLSSRGGRYELKKDFIELVEGTQAYQIPANRVVKNVFYETPSMVDYATFASWGYGNLGFGEMGGFGIIGGYAGFGAGYGYGTMYPLFPAHDVLLRASHYNLNDRIFNSELTYKITKGPNGTRILHLMSVPISRRGIRRELYSGKVWYVYYDTAPMSEEEANACEAECEKIYSPHQVDLPKQDYCDLNHWGKNFVRRWLTAMAKETLGRVRGKFKGKIVNIGGEGLELDYDIMLNESKEEFINLKDEVNEFLVSLRSDKQLERRAKESEDLQTVLSKVPLKIKVI
jgi:hypothetical protein